MGDGRRGLARSNRRFDGPMPVALGRTLAIAFDTFGDLVGTNFMHGATEGKRLGDGADHPMQKASHKASYCCE